MEKSRRVQLVPSMLAASCGAELTLQGEGITQNTSFGVCFLHLLLEEHWH